MTIISKPIMQIVMALTVALGLGFSTAQPAEARHHGGALAAGIIVGVVGAAIISNEIRRSHRRHRHWRRHHHHAVSCYRGTEQCGWVGHRECWYNRYDERVCRGGHYKCWRERICN